MWVFFKSGFTTAYLNSFGNLPELRDRFTMRVITGAVASTHRGKRWDGTGSDEEVDFGDDKIKSLISSIDAGWNNENVDDGLSGIVNGLNSIKGSFERSALILSTKKELDCSAERVDWGFNEDELERWQTWLIERHKDFESEQFLNTDEK